MFPLLWLSIPYGESSTYLFSRREFISIEKHDKRCCFPVGDLFYYVYFAMVIYPLRGNVRSQFALSMVIYPLRGILLYILFPGGNIFYHLSFYGYLSPTGKFSIHLFSRREFISIEKHYKRCCFPVGDIFYHLFFLWLFIPYGESSTYLFSRREFISIEKHYKRCCFPVGDLHVYSIGL